MATKLVTKRSLLIDVGNSTVKWAISTDLPVSNVLRQRYTESVNDDYFIHLWRDIVKPEKILVTCVARERIWQAVAEACFTLWAIKPQRIISLKQWQNVTNAYPETADLGSDRWCVIVAAHKFAGSDCIIVDCGTAITIDIVNKAGQHLGGYIMPGVEMMEKSLGLHTAKVKIEKINSESDTLMPGTSTAQCVQAGIYLAVVKSIEGVFEQFYKKNSGVQCYLTGGDADIIAEYLSVKYQVIPDLVLRGLAYFAEENTAI